MKGTISIRFPHLGIYFADLGRDLKIAGLKISLYEIVVIAAILVGFVFVIYEAYRTWQDLDVYINMTICAIIAGIIAGRIYYVLTEWSYFCSHPIQMLYIHDGGIEIVGSVIGGLVIVLWYSWKHEISFWKISDTVCTGLLLGQIIAKLGHLFSRDGFGSYTDGLFAMQIKYDEINGKVNQEMLDHMFRYDGVEYIQVHPVFFYESLWFLCLFVILLFARKWKLFDGEIFFWYIIGITMHYIWTEIIRVDKGMVLFFGMTVLQFLAILITIVLAIIIIVRHALSLRSLKNQSKTV